MFNIIKSRLRLKRRVQIWFHPAYIPELKFMANYERFSIKRTKKVLSTLRQQFLVFAKDLHLAPIISWSDLELFHDPKYLSGTINNPKTFLPLGIQLDTNEQETWIESQRYMVGGTLAATEAVLKKNCKIAFNLGGGLHHAESNYGTGFCLYNDIAVTVKKIRSQNCTKKILIIDLDYHQGNGNMLGLKDDPLTFQYSLQGHEWREVNSPNIFQYNLPLHAHDQEYLPVLEKTLLEFFEKVNPELVLYIAGTDVLKDDYFGEFKLTLAGAFKRDYFVYQLCKKTRCPLVITMGGGYSTKSWLSTYHFINFLLTDKIPKKRKEKINASEKHYARIALKLKKHMLGKTDNFEFSIDDLYLNSTGQNNNKAFGIYSKNGIEMLIERYGIRKKLQQKGHTQLHYELFVEADGSNLFRIWSTIKDETFLLIESKLSIQTLQYPKIGSLKLMKIEWLLAQDPTKKFNKEKSALPGQKFPGIGLSQDIMQLFIQACKRMNLDGMSHTPTHFHIALKTCRDFRYLDPIKEGRLMALKSFLLPYSLAEASTLAEEKKILDEVKNPVWPIEGDILCPISEKLIKYFESPEYQAKIREVYKQSFNNRWQIQ